ncbi:hypothetical protein [Brevundimonas sp.]|uniref:hypothetical protein n=1 Tax=Brevundimonas sp. TaxID=1871086 RepID=UPI00273792C3|nr:hypothetical protein [Brevundimonas sp.]MDP3802822.1 hypothetical protein [Brevundimonas sp.]
MILSPASSVRLRPATTDDAPMLAEWDREPHVIECSTDDPGADGCLAHRLEPATWEGRTEP